MAIMMGSKPIDVGSNPAFPTFHKGGSYLWQKKLNLQILK